MAVISIIGGFVTLAFYQLSTQWKRRVKLLAVGSIAGFVTVLGVIVEYNLYDFAYISQAMLASSVIAFGAITGVLWFEFYKIYKNKETNNGDVQSLLRK